MAEEPSIVDAESRRILAVRKKVRWTQIGKVAIPSLDEVWKHIRENDISGYGHNVFIYRGMNPLGVEASFGVEVPADVEAPKGLVIDHTPTGRAATFHQYGDYSKLIDTNLTIRKWCKQQDLKVGSISWDLYGDWNEDPSKQRTDVFYLLKA
jgi:hypothetical protein